MQFTAEGRQQSPRLILCATALDPSLKPRHTERHGHRLHLRDLWKEPKDDHAVAASCPCDTPVKTGYLKQAGQQRLNNKLRRDCLSSIGIGQRLTFPRSRE